MNPIWKTAWKDSEITPSSECAACSELVHHRRLYNNAEVVNRGLRAENIRLQRRAEKYEGLFYAALSLLAFLGSAWMLAAWG